MSKLNPLIEALKPMGKNFNNLATACDVDECVTSSMNTEIGEHGRNVFNTFNQITHGGFWPVTGRGVDGADQTFGQQYAGIFEHGTTIRLPGAENGELTYLAPRNGVTADMAALAQKLIAQHPGMTILDHPSQIHTSKDFGVVIEPKRMCLALVFTLNKPIDEINQHKSELINVSKSIVLEHRLEDTHDIRPGGDAIEIVPRGLCPTSDAHELFPAEEIAYLLEKGLKKKTVLRSLVSADERLHGKERDVVIALGDSEGDFLMGETAYEHYNGFLIPVLNGNTLPERFHQAAKYGPLVDHTKTIEMFAEANNYMRNYRHTVVMPDSGVNDLFQQPPALAASLK